MVAFKGMKRDKNFDLAMEMSRNWSDDLLASKQPEEIIFAYGVSLSQAKDVLKIERDRRKRMNDIASKLRPD